jgi:hypothetical protein
MTTIQIVSSNINVPVDSFRLDYVFQITLNSSVSFNVFVLSNNNVVYTRQMTLSGDDYKNWGNDDTYLINYVANQLGFTVKPVVKVSVTASSDVVGVTGSSSDVVGVTGSSSLVVGVTGFSSLVVGVTGASSLVVGVTGASSDVVGVTGSSSDVVGVTGSSSDVVGVTGSTQ